MDVDIMKQLRIILISTGQLQTFQLSQATQSKLLNMLLVWNLAQTTTQPRQLNVKSHHSLIPALSSTIVNTMLQHILLEEFLTLEIHLDIILRSVIRKFKFTNIICIVLNKYCIPDLSFEDTKEVLKNFTTSF